MRKIALCSDHAGYELKEIIRGYLESQDIEYVDFGTHSTDSCVYLRTVCTDKNRHHEWTAGETLHLVSGLVFQVLYSVLMSVF